MLPHVLLMDLWIAFVGSSALAIDIDSTFGFSQDKRVLSCAVEIFKFVTRRQITILCMGTALVTMGILLGSCLPVLINWIVRQQLKFTPGTSFFNNWLVNKEPYYYDFYFYNWTNPEQLFNASVKPKFEETGPYRYQLYIEKLDVNVHGNETVTYTLVKKFIPVQQEGTKSLDDVITTLNPIPNAIAYKSRNWGYFAKFGVSIALRSMGTKLHITKTAGELLFGYTDSLINAIRKMPLGSSLIDEKFGYWYKKNYTDFKMGPMTMNTRLGPNYGELISFKGKNHTDYYPGKCAEVGGITGEFTAMNRDVAKPIVIFVNELSTTIKLYYARKQAVKGVIGNRYELGPHAFDNGTYTPVDRCYCNGDCVPSGLINVSASYKDAPIFLSLPHFLNADPYYRDAIDIVEPHLDDDQFYATYEPVTGVPTSIGLRIQINMLLQPVSGLGIYANVPRIFFPILILNQTLILGNESINRIKPVQLVPFVSKILCLVLISTGIILMAFESHKILRGCRRVNKKKLYQGVRIKQQQYLQTL